MLRNMLITPGDTVTFSCSESVCFDKVKACAKSNQVTPAAQLVKILADAIESEKDMNKKLS